MYIKRIFVTAGIGIILPETIWKDKFSTCKDWLILFYSSLMPRTGKKMGNEQTNPLRGSSKSANNYIQMNKHMMHTVVHVGLIVKNMTIYYNADTELAINFFSR